MKNKITSMVLVVCLLVSMFNLSVFAADNIAVSGVMNSGVSWSYDIDTKTLSFTAPSADAGMFLDLEDAPWTAAIQAYGVDAYYIGEGIAFIEYGVIDGEFAGNITAYMVLSDSLSTYCPNANITYVDLDTSSFYVPEQTPADYQSSLTVNFTIEEGEGYCYFYGGSFKAPANTTFLEFFKGFAVVEFNNFVFVDVGGMIFKLKNQTDAVYVSPTDYIENGKVYYAEYYDVGNSDIYDLEAAFNEENEKYGLNLTDDWYHISIDGVGHYIPAGYTWGEWVNSHYYHGDLSEDIDNDAIISDGKILIDDNYLVPATGDNLVEFSDVADHEHINSLIKDSNLYGLFSPVYFKIQNASTTEDYVVAEGTTWDTWVASIQNRNSYAIDTSSSAVEDSYGALVTDDASASVMSYTAIRPVTYSVARTVSTIEFTIDGATYTADDGQSFAEWIASDYNTLGLVVGDSGITNAAGTYALTLSGSSVDSSLVINAGDAYSLIEIEEEIPTISFTIDGTSYTADEGQTFVEWIASDYNTAGLVISNSNITTSDGSYILTLADSNVASSTVINSGNAYTLTMVETTPSTNTFTIDGVEYTVSEGQRIADWINSESNTLGLVTVGTYCITADGSKYLADTNNDAVKRTTTISDGDVFALVECATYNLTIDEITYTFKEYSKVSDWVASDYNTGGFTINDSKQLTTSDGKVVYAMTDGVATSAISQGRLLTSTTAGATWSSNVTEVPAASIGFTIDGNKYTATEGQTFSEWVGSKNNTLGLVVGKTTITTSDGASVLTLNGTEVSPSTVITSGSAYTLVANSANDGEDTTEGSNDTVIIVDAEPTNFLVTVPIKVVVTMDADGNIDCGSGYYVENDCAMGPVIITDVKVVAETNWQIVDWDSDFHNMKASSKNIALTINEVEVAAGGAVTLNDSLSSVIRNKEKKELTFDAKLPAQKSALQANAAAVVFTVDFDKV